MPPQSKIPSRDWPAVSVALLLVAVALLPLRPSALSISDHNLQRYLQIAALSLVPLALLTAPLRTGWLPITCLALAGTSAWHGTHSALALMDVFVGAASICAAVLVGRMLARQPRLCRMVPMLAAAFLSLYAAQTLAAYTAALAGRFALNKYDLFLGVDNVRFFNHAQTVAMLLVVPLLTHERRLLKVIGCGTWTIAIWLLLLSGGRATMVAIAGALAIGAALSRCADRALWRSIVVASVTGAAVSIFLLYVYPVLFGAPVVDLDTLHRSLQGDVTSYRTELWRAAWLAAIHHPLLGLGPAHFAEVTPQASHPHDIVLQLLSETGFVTAGLLLSAFALLMWHQWRTRLQVNRSTDAYDARISQWSWLAVVAACIDGLFSGNFVMPVSQAWIVLAAAAMLATSNPQCVRPRFEVGVVAWMLSVVVAAVLVSMLWAGARADLISPFYVNIAKPRPGAFGPRLWDDGAMTPRLAP